jgi:hypothetical protein
MRCGKNLKRVLTIATLVERISVEAMGAPVVRYGKICIWQESGFGRHEVVFTFHLLYKEML